MGFLTTLLSARLLGPERYGDYASCMAFAALLLPLAGVASDGVYLREFVRAKTPAGTVLGTGILVRLVAGLLVMAACILVAHGWLLDRPQVVPLLLGIGAGTCLQAAWVAEQLLLAHLQIAWASSCRCLCMLVGLALKVLALHSAQPFTGLAVAYVVEAGLCGLLFLAGSRRVVTPAPSPRFSGDYLRELAPQLLPLIVSGIAVALYSRLNILMLAHFHGQEQAGVYAASTALSEAWYALPMAVMAAWAPRLARSHATDLQAFQAQQRKLIRLLSGVGLGCTALTWLAAEPAIHILFGEAYGASVSLLRMHMVSTWLVFISAASDPWYINHRLQSFVLKKTLMSAAVNLVLSLLLIPSLAGPGAVIATLVTYSFSAVLGNAVWPATRPLFRLQIRNAIPFIPLRHHA